jgi:hypothetical protein
MAAVAGFIIAATVAIIASAEGATVLVSLLLLAVPGVA